MSYYSEHQIAHTKMVKQALKAVARHNNFPYCSQCVWENFYRFFPETPWHYVSFYNF